MAGVLAPAGEWSHVQRQPDDAVGPRYKRVLLKISGEALMGEREYGIDPAMVDRIAQEVQAVARMGVEVCLVIGGGNIFRGVAGAAAGHGARQRRLHGHAGDGDERARHAERAGAAGRRTPACSRPSR